MLERHAMVEQHDCRMCCLCCLQECFDVGVWLDRSLDCKLMVGPFKALNRPSIVAFGLLKGIDGWKHPVSN